MPDKVAGGEEDAVFRMTDRRRPGREGSGEAPPAADPAGTADPHTTGQTTAEAPGREAPVLPVADLVRLFIGELHARAWVHMGLVANPVTKQAAKDLPQARLAIDFIASLVEQLGPVVEQAERDELGRLLADLRINYVRQSGA